MVQFSSSIVDGLEFSVFAFQGIAVHGTVFMVHGSFLMVHGSGVWMLIGEFAQRRN
jgi:hypothetical protein